MLLEQLGWNSYFAAMWNEFVQEAGWLPARVVGQGRGLWRIAGALEAGAREANAGKSVGDNHDIAGGGMVGRSATLAQPNIDAAGELWATASGKLREQAEAGGDWPAVGDWVASEVPSGELRGMIHGVLPRRSQFVRKTPGKEIAQQVIAANVDTAFLVSAIDGDFNVRRIERYLAQTWESGAAPVILLNKVDQPYPPGVPDSDPNASASSGIIARVAEVERIAEGVPVLPISGRTGHGLDALTAFLAPGRTVVLLGSSGVGKSTLVNRLLGRDAQSTQPIRESDSRGRHTTTSRELLRLPNGAMLIDTPGLRELQLWGADQGVTHAFADIEGLAAECRFRDCRHVSEPGCAVLAAIATGDLDEARLLNRRKLEREREFLRRKMDPEARSQAHDKLRATMRGVNKMYKQRDKDRSQA